MDQRHRGHLQRQRGCPGSLKADQVVWFSRKDSAGTAGTPYCPSWTSVQGMFKVAAYCLHAPSFSDFPSTGYAPVLLKHDTLSFGFIPNK